MSRNSLQTCPTYITLSIYHYAKQMHGIPMPRYILCQCLAALGLSLTSSFDRPGTIGRLSDHILLNVFCYYLHESPRFWPTLVHICRKWRHIVFGSQQALHLRLFCTPGTPVLKTLDTWPTLPIVIEYGGALALDPPSPEDELNVVAALKKSNRVSSISLTVTTSLLDKLYAIKRPFLELEDLIFLSRDRVPLTLPSSFLWGPRLRRLHLNRITSPALFQLLHSSKDLVDLQLHEAFNPWFFPIEGLTDALSSMARLRSLSLHFSTTTVTVPPSPPDRRVLGLPALTHLKFQGPAKYFERLILRIDAPRLGDIQVTVSEIVDYNLSRLGEFVNRIDIHKLHYQARILSSDRAISISLTQPGTSTCFQFRLLSEKLSEQLFAMSYILPGFSAILSNVEDLRISATQASSQEDSIYSGRWLGLLNSFIGVKWLHLDGNHSTDIVLALQGMHRWHNTTVLPALYKLYLPQSGPRHAPLSEVIVSFMTSCWHSGRPIGVEYERRCCISELHHEKGTSLCKCLYSTQRTNCLKQDLFLSQSRSIMRCSPMTSFSTSFDNIWTPLRGFGLFSYTYAEGGNGSY